MRPGYYKVKVKARSAETGERCTVTVECFDLIDALGFGFYLGNALKYLFRVGRKHPDRTNDLSKVITYCKVVKERDAQGEDKPEGSVANASNPSVWLCGCGWSAPILLLDVGHVPTRNDSIDCGSCGGSAFHAFPARTKGRSA